MEITTRAEGTSLREHFDRLFQDLRRPFWIIPNRFYYRREAIVMGNCNDYGHND